MIGEVVDSPVLRTSTGQPMSSECARSLPKYAGSAAVATAVLVDAIIDLPVGCLPVRTAELIRRVLGARSMGAEDGGTSEQEVLPLRFSEAVMFVEVSAGGAMSAAGLSTKVSESEESLLAPTGC